MPPPRTISPRSADVVLEGNNIVRDNKHKHRDDDGKVIRVAVPATPLEIELIHVLVKLEARYAALATKHAQLQKTHEQCRGVSH